MQSAPEHIPLGECSQSQSQDQFTPGSTVFSLSHSESLWTTQLPRSACEFYRHAILLMSTGGSILACGLILSGLYFAGYSKTSTNILGPALLSIGLMVLVVGVVLIPITRETRHHTSMKRLYGYKPQFNF